MCVFECLDSNVPVEKIGSLIQYIIKTLDRTLTAESPFCINIFTNGHGDVSVGRPAGARDAREMKHHSYVLILHYS